MDEASTSDSFSDNSYDSDLDRDFDKSLIHSALFDSVAFDGQEGDADDYDVSGFLFSETSLTDHDSYGSQEDYLEDNEQKMDVILTGAQSDDLELQAEDIEYQRENLEILTGHQTHSESHRSSSQSIRVEKRRRSEYAARRCKSVDIMTERLMIHADEYCKNNYPARETCRSKAVRYACMVICLLALAMATILIMDLSAMHQQQEPEQEAIVQLQAPTESQQSIQSSDSSLALDRLNAFYVESLKPVNVPFATRHNLDFNGLMFVKRKESGKHNGSYSTEGSFDSYAKTLDPITELHFEPGEADTTKQIVLTYTNPMSQKNRYNQESDQELEDDPGLILSIGLKANGELWLPSSTGQRMANLDASSLRSTRHHGHQEFKKSIYGPGDRFVLTITDYAISLFRNDYHELIGMWDNPSSPQTTNYKNTLVSSHSSSTQPIAKALYAQIWFKEENSSMLATAWHNHEVEETRNGMD